MGLRITIELEGSNYDPSNDSHQPSDRVTESKVQYTLALNPMNGPSLMTLESKFDSAVFFTRKLMSE